MARSNWLTVPLFLLTWPVALLTGHLALTFAVFGGVYVATKLEPRAGAADCKLMVGLAAFAPLALGIGCLSELAVLAALRLHGRRETAIPGVLWLYVGSLLVAHCWTSSQLLGWVPIVSRGPVIRMSGSRELQSVLWSNLT